MTDKQRIAESAGLQGLLKDGEVILCLDDLPEYASDQTAHNSSGQSSAPAQEDLDFESFIQSGSPDIIPHDSGSDEPHIAIPEIPDFFDIGQPEDNGNTDEAGSASAFDDIEKRPWKINILVPCSSKSSNRKAIKLISRYGEFSKKQVKFIFMAKLFPAYIHVRSKKQAKKISHVIKHNGGKVKILHT